MRVHEAVEEALAEEFVRLQGSTLQQLLDASQTQSQGLAAAIDVIAQRAYDAWQAAGDQAAYHLFVTLRVNQDRPLASVLAQPDIQAVLRRPFEHATDVTREAIGDAWTEGAAQGLAAANQDLAIAGHEPVGPVRLDQNVLSQLMDDAGANGDASRERFLASIQTNDPDAVRAAVRQVGSSQALRARVGVDTAGKYAASNTKSRALASADRDLDVTVYKVWVTSFSATTCRFCAALHGTRRKLNESFPSTARFGGGTVQSSWAGPLGHPPRHPNCRCRIVMHESSFEDEDGPTISGMRAVALRWWRTLTGALGLSGVELAQSTSPFVPDNFVEGVRPNERIVRYLFKHTKKGFHGRKAWSVEMLERPVMSGGKPVTYVFRKGAGAGQQQWTTRSNALFVANHCPDCGLASVDGGHAVKGTYSPDVTCNMKCISATGHTCECQCGGKNHGIGWS